MLNVEISNRALEQLSALLSGSDSDHYGIAVLMAGPAIDHVRTDDGKYEWQRFGERGWLIARLSLTAIPSERIHTFGGIKFVLNPDAPPTSIDFVEGHFIIDGESVKNVI